MSKQNVEVESPNVIPFLISREAWECAMTILGEVDKIHAEAGFVRKTDIRSKSTEIAAKLVQLAINKFFHRTQSGGSHD